MSESVVVHDGVDESKRTWLGWTCGAGAVAGVATAIPFVSTFAPSERAKAAGAAVEVDISDLQMGEKKTVEWRGQPVWIVRRTPEMVASLSKDTAELADPDSKRNPDEQTPPYARNEHRSIIAEANVRGAQAFALKVFMGLVLFDYTDDPDQEARVQP